MITLDPVTAPLPLVRTWLVRGTKAFPDGTQCTYTGTSWGRTEAQARERHARLAEADRRVAQAVGRDRGGPDLDGWVLTFTALPEGL